MMSYVDLLALSMTLLAVMTLILTVDDVVIDSLYWINKCYKKFIKKGQSPELPSIQQIQTLKEQTIAIMVPAWHEQDVIAKMIQHLCSHIDYQHYQIFIGTYPNDAETIAEVERIKKYLPQVHRIEVDHNGPTNKADCLNAIYKGIQQYENKHLTLFHGYLLHDSEDVLHPLELKLFNALLPHYDLIQIPVRAIEHQLSSLVSGTYIDEFAEWHTKDIVIRSLLTKVVPSAGVGTCFSKKALYIASQQNTQPPFNTQCVTEDYEVSLRIGLHGLPSLFALYHVPYSTKNNKKTTMRPLAVQEYFPHTLKTAYKQKARWILGIGLQGWKTFGWQGTWLNRYFLYRDRKSLITPLINMLSYVIVGQLIIISLADSTLYQYYIQSLSPWVRNTYFVLSFILLFRLIQRAYFVATLYNWRHGLLVFPRVVINNVINFMAAVRAWRLFLSAVIQQTPVVWDKTTHQYPEFDQKKENSSLLFLLKQQGLLSDKEIKQIPVSVQQEDNQLAHYLYQKNNIDQNQLSDIIAYQTGLPLAYIKENDTPYLSQSLPKEVYQHPEAIPFKLKDNNCLCIATITPLSEPTLNYFRQITHYSIEQYIAPLCMVNCLRETAT